MIGDVTVSLGDPLDEWDPLLVLDRQLIEDFLSC